VERPTSRKGSETWGTECSFAFSADLSFRSGPAASPWADLSPLRGWRKLCGLICGCGTVGPFLDARVGDLSVRDLLIGKLLKIRRRRVG